jgi:hypothetical protein
MTNQVQNNSSVNSVTTEQEAKRDFIEKFADNETSKLMSTEIKPTLKLVDGVNIDIQNQVLDKSTDPVQQAFLTLDPGARILTTAITVSGDTESLLKFGSSFVGNITGSYEVQIELPFKDFAGGTWEAQLNNAKARLYPVIELVRLDSDHFWNEVKEQALLPGTRISRTFNVGGGAKLTEDDVSANTSRNTQVKFETKWIKANGVTVTFDLLRTDSAGIGVNLGKIGINEQLNGSNHQIHTYNDLLLTGSDADKTLQALKESVSWTNGLLPAFIDTSKLDMLRLGTHSIDVLIGTKGGVSVYLPVGDSIGISAGGSISDTEQITVSVPDHLDNNVVVYDQEAKKWVAALAITEVNRLAENTIQGLVAQRVGTGTKSLNLSVSLTKGAELLPGWVGAGAVLTFAANTSEEDVVGIKIEYLRDNSASVTVWKTDTRKMTEQLKLELGLTMEPAMQQEISNALSEYLLGGIGLEKYADTIGKEGFNELKKAADKMKFNTSFSYTSTAYGYESLGFTDFNLKDPIDRAAFETLVGTRQGPNDSQALALAIQNGHLTDILLIDRAEQSSSIDAQFAGIKLLTVDAKDWQSGQIRDKRSEVIIDGKRVEEWIQAELIESGASSEGNNLTSKYNFEASTFVVTKEMIIDGIKQPPTSIDSMIHISYDATYDNFNGNERNNLERAISAGGYRITEQKGGDGSWWLGWLFGDNYGKVTINFKGVINGVGTVNIMKADPLMAAQTAVCRAACLKGVSLPPSEKSVPGGISTNLATLYHQEQARLDGLESDDAKIFSVLSCPTAVNLSAEKILDVHNEVRANLSKLEKDGSISTAALNPLKMLNDNQLDDLIRRSFASQTLKKYRDASQNANISPNAEWDSEQAIQDYSMVTAALGETRNIGIDLWICEQGISVFTAFDQPEVKNARFMLLNGQNLNQSQIQTLVGDFRKLAKYYQPTCILFDHDADREAITFWITLLTLAGHDQNYTPCGLGQIKVNGEKYLITAVSDGVDLNLLAQLQNRTVQNVFDDVVKGVPGADAK